MTTTAMHRRLAQLSAKPTTPTVRLGRPSLEDTLIDIITAPPAAGETVTVSYVRKEAAIRGAFASLKPLDALQLHRRLVAARADDSLAAAFGRLVVDRRGRLLAFLADARRRQACGV